MQALGVEIRKLKKPPSYYISVANWECFRDRTNTTADNESMIVRGSSIDLFPVTLATTKQPVSCKNASDRAFHDGSSVHVADFL